MVREANADLGSLCQPVQRRRIALHLFDSYVDIELWGDAVLMLRQQLHDFWAAPSLPRSAVGNGCTVLQSQQWWQYVVSGQRLINIGRRSVVPAPLVLPRSITPQHARSRPVVPGVACTPFTLDINHSVPHYCVTTGEDGPPGFYLIETCPQRRRVRVFTHHTVKVLTGNRVNSQTVNPVVPIPSYTRLDGGNNLSGWLGDCHQHLQHTGTFSTGDSDWFEGARRTRFICDRIGLLRPGGQLPVHFNLAFQDEVQAPVEGLLCTLSVVGPDQSEIARGGYFANERHHIGHDIIVEVAVTRVIVPQWVGSWPSTAGILCLHNKIKPFDHRGLVARVVCRLIGARQKAHLIHTGLDQSGRRTPWPGTRGVPLKRFAGSIHQWPATIGLLPREYILRHLTALLRLVKRRRLSGGIRPPGCRRVGICFTSHRRLPQLPFSF